ncbi:hypothetical protein ACV3XK_06390 [Clostridium perfringens]
MNIQGKVRVGAMDYDVILTDEKIINQDGEECLGLTDHNLHEIKISTNLQNEQGQINNCVPNGKPLIRKYTPITINMGEFGKIETSLDEISESLTKDLYKKLGIGVGLK